MTCLRVDPSTIVCVAPSYSLTPFYRRCPVCHVRTRWSVYLGSYTGPYFEADRCRHDLVEWWRKPWAQRMVDAYEAARKP